ncbi:MAG: hypothetical protein HRF40_11785 [Nitrososphaera sp.]
MMFATHRRRSELRREGEKTFRYAKLLDENPDLRRWYENTHRGGPVVADPNLRRIGYVCSNFNVTTGKMQAMSPEGAGQSDFRRDN